MLLCLIAFLTPAAIQNYRGVCLSEGRILTDEEKLNGPYSISSRGQLLMCG